MMYVKCKNKLSARERHLLWRRQHKRGSLENKTARLVQPQFRPQ